MKVSKVFLVCQSVTVITIITIGAMFYLGCTSGREKGSPLDNADLVRGGQLYDKWWKVSGVLDPNEPTTDNPGYALTQGTQTGSDTWRCKECHGWDYKGSDGAYKQGSSHYTGVMGLMHASEEDAPEELFEAIGEGVSGMAMSSYSPHLSDQDIWDIVKFIKEGIIDEAQYIDYLTKKPIGANTSNGQTLFNSVCASCHGYDGKQINVAHEPGETEYVGTVANENPWEVMHKIRFGMAGTPMPSAIKNGWSIQDVVDVLGYAQTLPVQ